MNEQTRDDFWNSLLTLTVVAAVGLLAWMIVRKRRAVVAAVLPAVVPPPLVSPWMPLP